jgi:hypothetical protein
MRLITPIIAALVLVLLPQSTAPAVAQPPSAIEASLTVAGMVGRIRAASSTIVRSAGKEFSTEATATVAELEALASAIEGDLAGHAETPVSQVPGALERKAARGMAALIMAENLAVSLETCMREDVATLLEAFRANARLTIGRPESWNEERPKVLRMTSAGGTEPFTVRTGAAHAIVLHGEQLHSDDCGEVSARIAGPGGESMEALAVSQKDGTVAVEISPLDQAGVHDVTVRVRRRKLLFLCQSASATVSIAVLPEAAFRVQYTISSVQTRLDEIVWNAGELRVGNARCDGDTIAAQTFRLPEGWTYASHEWIVFLNKGALKEKEEVRGNEVYVEYVVPRRGPLCLGEERLIHGKMEIHGTRETVVQGPSSGGPIARTLGYDETISIPMRRDSLDATSAVEWTIDVRLVYPNGKAHAMPASTGAGPLAGSESGGGSYVWDPEKGRLRISAPARECGRR